MMFGFEQEKMLTITINETAMKKKWILPGRSEQTAEKGDCVYECVARLLI